MSKENFAEKMKAAKAAKEAEKMKDASIESVKKEIENKKPVKITSSEIQVESSEFHNFGTVLFEKNKPTFLTDKVLDKLLELPNFKDLVDKGVIKIGL